MNAAFINQIKVFPDFRYSSTLTEDKQLLSVLFDNATAASHSMDMDWQPNAAVFDLQIGVNTQEAATCRVEARGARIMQGAHSWAYAWIWVNGQRLPVAHDNSDSLGNTVYAASLVKIEPGEPLRVSMSLMAQRDLSAPNSGASIVIDALDCSIESV